jgi:adenine-specific DNA-methyltransferase
MYYTKKTTTELIALCKEKKITGYSGKKKSVLISLLTNSTIPKNVKEKQEFSQLSKSLTQKINKEQKKKDGIYFTPKSIIQKNMETITPFLSSVKTVLEPSCGSCEFINQLDKLCADVKITCIEYNETIYDEIKELEFQNETTIIRDDFLKWTTDIEYDLILGNPPYFVIPKKEVAKEYHEYFDGRPNIFVLFLIKSLQHLAPNGILSFILPKSFTNCLYYDKLRKHIYENFTIVDIIECGKDDTFLDTKQDTIHFIVQNVKPTSVLTNDEFTISVNEYKIFNTRENILKLKDLYQGSTTLRNMNYGVHVGTVVWNQCKDILTSDKTKTRLIYSSDIIDGVLTEGKEYSNQEKKNYIEKEGTHEVQLVINRGYGVGKYHFNHCIIDVDMPYLIENHLICVKYNGDKTREELVLIYQKIVESLNMEKTQEFINIYFGNNAMNTTELNCMLPIYIL